MGSPRGEVSQKFAHWVTGCGEVSRQSAHWVTGCGEVSRKFAHWVAGAGEVSRNFARGVVGSGGVSWKLAFKVAGCVKVSRKFAHWVAGRRQKESRHNKARMRKRSAAPKLVGGKANRGSSLLARKCKQHKINRFRIPALPIETAAVDLKKISKHFSLAQCEMEA